MERCPRKGEMYFASASAAWFRSKRGEYKTGGLPLHLGSPSEKGLKAGNGAGVPTSCKFGSRLGEA